MKKKEYFVYILLCINGSFYTGYTTNLKKRFQEHLSGTAKCKYTRSFKPVKVMQSWRLKTKTKALRAEYLIKKLKAKEKKYLIKNPKTLNI